MPRPAILTLAALSLFATTAHAADYVDPARRYFEANIAPWIESAEVVDAIRAANAAHATLTQADIDALDQLWRAEVGTASTPTISAVMDSPASAFLRDRRDAAGGAITEIFTMDALGLNVAASDVTSDYWQGDEDKHKATFGAGAGSLHLSEVEFDESTQTYQLQVSAPITDPDNGAVIGAITVGLDAEAIE